MGWPNPDNKKDMARLKGMHAEIIEWDEAVRPYANQVAQVQLDERTWDGAPDGTRLANLVERLRDTGAPAHPFNPPAKNLGSASNCGGPYGQSFPNNYGIFCQLPPSDFPTRFKWNPNFWPSNDSVSCFHNSVAVTEAGWSSSRMSNPTPWGWWTGAHDFSHAVHSLFGLPGNPYVMGDNSDDWAALHVLIYW